jgi:ParB/RepB/Spo0J family partition protein
MSQVIDRPVAREARMIPLSRLHPRPGFNPRSTRDREQYAQLAASVKLKGVLQSLLVASHPELEGEFVITDGERRYLAAGDASLMEVPCTVDVPDAETGGLDDALIANMIRADLCPLDEARGFKRLLEHGLNIKGIAERLSRTPKFVRERLELLVLPEQVQQKVDAGTVPLTAVASLAKLAGIHAELPTLAVAKVLTAPDRPHYSYHQPTWADVIEDPIGVVVAGGYTVELPSDVYVGGGEYALECFSLSAKAQRDLDKLLEIALDATVEDVTVTFGRTLIEQAAALKVTHVGTDGQVLIVGQDVADQLAGDAIALMLKDARQREKEALTQLRRQTAARANGDSDAIIDPEAQRKAQAAEQREQDKVDRRKAIAHNEALGTAVLNTLTKIKVDVRVLKILAAINFGGDLGDIAARGARYCLPYDYWTQSRKLDSGAMKTEMVDANLCTGPAQTWLEGARGQADYAGRLLSLAVMARFADQRAMPRSRRSFYELRAGRELPWADEVIDLVDEIACELLPEHLTADVLAPKRTQEAEIEAARVTLERALADPAALSDEEREAAIDAADTVHGLSDAYDEVIERLEAPTSAADAADAAAEDTPDETVEAAAAA